jgi:membrane protease YdiL (CAAX protease family)
MRLAKYQFNWLLKLAIFSYCQFFLCQLILENEIKYSFEYGKNNFTSPFLFLLIFILLPPVIEELIYRGIFKNNTYNKIYLAVFYLGSTWMMFNTGFKIWWVFVVVTPLIVLIILKTGNSLRVNLIFIYSALLFTLAHFNNENTFKEYILLSGNYFGAALLLSWVVTNFGFFKAILVHLSYNILAFSFFVFVGNTLTDSNIFQDNIAYNIEKVDIFSKSYGIKRTNDSFIADGASISIILAHLEIPENKKVFIKSPIDKFNISIQDKSNNLEDEEILKILQYSEVIQVR